MHRIFLFSILVFFTFALLVLFFLFYLRHRRVNWGVRNSEQAVEEVTRPSESGIKKELRELFPVVVFRESFSIREPRCCVCLADYKSEDRLKRVPPCGHTFHVDCIDHWLSTNTTCLLCRSSLVPTPRLSLDPANLGRQNDLEAQGNGQDVLVVEDQQHLRCGEADTTDATGIETPERLCNSDRGSVQIMKDSEHRHDENHDAMLLNK